MAKAPLHECNQMGCHVLTEQTYCDKHKRQPEYGRKSACKRGYGRRWQSVSKAYLANHPFCVRCLENKLYTRSEVVDHIIPHKGDMELFWDKNNWQALCKTCHDRKTATEDGGFGR